MRVLVIDHEVAAARSLVALVRNENHEVDVAHDEKAALDLARRSHPALVFLALTEAGYALAHRLRALPGCEHTAIAAVSDSQPYDEEAARAAGIEFRLSKPVRIDRVLAILEDVESRRRP